MEPTTASDMKPLASKRHLTGHLSQQLERKLTVTLLSTLATSDRGHTCSRQAAAAEGLRHVLFLHTSATETGQSTGHTDPKMSGNELPHAEHGNVRRSPLLLVK